MNGLQLAIFDRFSPNLACVYVMGSMILVVVHFQLWSPGAKATELEGCSVCTLHITNRNPIFHGQLITPIIVLVTI